MSKAVLRTAATYLARLRAGERIMRDASGTLQWTSGRHVGRKTVQHMLTTGQIQELDTDIFGDPHHGQTLGVETPAHKELHNHG